LAQGSANKCVLFPTCQSFKDTFDTSPLSPEKWTNYSDVDGGGRVENGTLVLSGGTNKTVEAGFSGVLLAERFSLIGNQCSLQIGNLLGLKGSAESGDVQFDLFDQPNESGVVARLSVDVNGMLDAVIKGADAGTLVSSRMAYDPALHRFIRFREANGVIFLEVSANGIDFDALVAEKVQRRISDIRFALGLYQVKPRGDAGPEFVFDNFNAP
jgi:hypothetical protein